MKASKIPAREQRHDRLRRRAYRASGDLVARRTYRPDRKRLALNPVEGEEA